MYNFTVGVGETLIMLKDDVLICHPEILRIRFVEPTVFKKDL